MAAAAEKARVQADAPPAWPARFGRMWFAQPVWLLVPPAFTFDLTFMVISFKS